MYEFKKAIKDWELNYILKSSVIGQISFLQLWSVNQAVTAGDNVFAIIPTTANGCIGNLKAQSLNAGKIKISQIVNIRLANYPDREFGILNVRIKNISLTFDKDGNLLIDVSLPNGLQTFYKNKLFFSKNRPALPILFWKIYDYLKGFCISLEMFLMCL